MLKVGVLVSGDGISLQAILNAMDHGDITNVEISMVISSNPGAYALERARRHGIRTVCISPKQSPTGNAFNQAFPAKIDEYDLDLIILAGFLVVIPAVMTKGYKGCIIGIYPSLIPSLCGVSCYGLKVHRAALTRGVRVTGATVYYVGGSMDTGPTIPQKAVEAGEGDIPEILQRRVMGQTEWIILPKTINVVANGQ